MAHLSPSICVSRDLYFTRLTAHKLYHLPSTNPDINNKYFYKDNFRSQYAQETANSRTTIVQGHIFFNPVFRSLEFGENIMFKKLTLKIQNKDDT